MIVKGKSPKTPKLLKKFISLDCEAKNYRLSLNYPRFKVFKKVRSSLY